MGCGLPLGVYRSLTVTSSESLVPSGPLWHHLVSYGTIWHLMALPRTSQRVSDETARPYPAERAQSSLFPIFG
ncbi:hypothetical protein E2C01_023890 [Portunus trituberculatus]|uniref:Uncharacterized protein n=1 Tax=Portunus trituberculatus TaxID=210409 RepID=A0A5B7ECE6_PORTR|nr:hypothetical protein [Portunus trituberculatus]